MIETSKHFPYFNGEGKIRALLRKFDWTSCALGHPRTWPQELHTVVELTLQTRSPAVIAWGPEFIMLYNDAYAEALGIKHPKALGGRFEHAWPEVWPEIQPIFDNALAGNSAYFEDAPFTIATKGIPEQRWFTSSYSPVRNGDGKVVGVYNTAVETTRRVLSEKRHAFQLELTDRLRALIAPNDIMASASELLGKRLCAARVGYVEIDDSGEIATMKPDWTNKELPSMAGGVYRLEDFGAPIGATLRAGNVVVINDIAIDERCAPYADAYTAIGVRAALAIPLVKAGRLRALLQVHQPCVHQWTELDVALAEDMVERTWAAAERAYTEEKRQQAEEELRRNADRQAFLLKLADRLRPLTAPDEIAAAASELLGRHMGVSRVLYAEVDDANGTIFIRRDWTSKGFASLAGETKTMSDFGPELIAALRSGEVVATDDVALSSRTANYTHAYVEIGVRAVLLVPLIKAGTLSVVLTVHCAEPHQWKAEDIHLAQDLAERTWSAVENARAQAELRAERDQSQYIFDNMFEGFALLDQNWTLLRVNEIAAQIAQRPRSELIGCNHWEAVPELVGSEVEALYRRVRETGKGGTVEHLHTLSSGARVWVEIRAYPSLEGRLAIFFRDITKRKQAEQELHEASRRKDEFLAMLAHELRNPLAPISAAAELLQVTELDEARVRRTSEVIGRQVDHMTHLVDDLLDVSRVTRGLVELDEAALDIRHIVTDAVEQVSPIIRARRHHLVLHLPPDTTVVMGDKKRLVQIIANLLNNAAKYTHEGGNIMLKTEVHERHVLVSVVDDGIGMEPKLTARAFELFAQAQRTSDRLSGGLGLGLALVKSLVELHGGTVTCVSEGLGKGSKFSICLPRLLVQIDSHQPSTGRQLQRADRSLRILVVDDNVDAATMLTMLLEASGHQVFVEHGSRQGLERARAEHPDVCLLDIGLPDMDGNELALRLRAQPETANAILVAVTGYGQESDRKHTLAAGFDHHLVKPIDTGRLGEILAELGNA
jgi:PAS domain S-box-containing protein